ncbi:DUF4160 domain-containing protein [Bacteroidota bacterium]
MSNDQKDGSYDEFTYKTWYESQVRMSDEYRRRVDIVRRGREPITDQRELSQDDVEYLQTLLSIADSPQNVKLLLDEIGHLKLRMRPERNHMLPHFHVEYKRQYTGSFSIDPLNLLKGDLPNKYEKQVLAWAKPRIKCLLATWSNLQAGMDVREFDCRGFE